jgi:hypothetical protein
MSIRHAMLALLSEGPQYPAPGPESLLAPGETR